MCHPCWAQAFNSDTSVSSTLFPAAATQEDCTDKEVKRHPPEADGYPECHMELQLSIYKQ